MNVSFWSGWEWFGAITALLCIWLTVKNKIANWPWGIASVLAYGWVFWQSKIYASVALQIFYFLPCCVYGWHVWAKYGPNHNDDLSVTKLPHRVLALWCLFAAVITPLMGYLLSRTNDPLPYTDGFITALSIVAQYLQAKKIFENWYFWITIDVISAGYFYPALSLKPTTALYWIFLLLAIWGAVEWRPLIGKPVVHA